MCVFWKKFVVIPSDRRERRNGLYLRKRNDGDGGVEERVWTSNHTKPSGSTFEK